MGWRGATRSLVAVGRAIDRDNKRAARENERYQRERAKQTQYENALAAAEQFDEIIDELTSLHCIKFVPKNWPAVAKMRPPDAPKVATTLEDRARCKADAYSAGFFDRLFNQETKRRTELAAAIQCARAEDDRIFGEQSNAHSHAMEQWQVRSDRARSMLEGDHKAIMAQLADEKPCAGVDHLGRRVEFAYTDAGVWRIDLFALSPDGLPNTVISVLSSGKLSEKAMPKGQFYAIHLANVAGAAIRCALEFFAAVPVDRVFVDAKLDILDPATGHLESQPVLSVEFVRDTFARINLRSAEADRVLENFRHNMKFMKTKGFQPVQSLAR